LLFFEDRDNEFALFSFRRAEIFTGQNTEVLSKASAVKNKQCFGFGVGTEIGSSENPSQ
jgi:hypothetical protein